MSTDNAKRPSLLRGLLGYYSAPLNVAFRQFRAGVIYFAVGLGTILMANEYMIPSLSQELVTLGGLLLGGLGFIMALTAEMRLLIGRLVRFFTS